MIQIVAALAPGAEAAAADVSGPVTGAQGGTGFLALFARTLAGQGTKADPAAALAELLGGATAADAPLADANAKDKSAPVGGQGNAADPTALALLQSLGIPALMSGMNNAVPAQLQTGKDTPVSVSLTPEKGKKLPIALATLAGKADAAEAQASPDASRNADAFLAVLKSRPARAEPFAQALPDDKSTSRAASDIQAGIQAVQPHLMTPQDTAATAANTAAARPAIAMQSSFGSGSWQQEFGDKIAWMASPQGHVSDLVLNPPSLGTVEVRLHVNGNEAGAQFYAANPDVRNALEAAMPRLRDMLAGAGIALGNAMVSDQSFSQREPFQPRGQSGASASNSAVLPGIEAMDGVTGAGGRIHVGNGLLDYYA